MFDEIISKTKLQVRRECQFFGALMLFATIKESKKIDTACTDGKDIFFNKSFLESLKSSEQNALMLHEVLHIALLHVQRRQSRDPEVWNIAADIVVNDLILRNTTFKLPKGAIINHSYKDKSVEYIYETLLKNNKYKKYSLSISDLGSYRIEEGDGNGSVKVNFQRTSCKKLLAIGRIKYKFLRTQMHLVNQIYMGVIQQVVYLKGWKERLKIFSSLK